MIISMLGTVWFLRLLRPSVRMMLSGYASCRASDHAIVIQATVGIDDNRLSQIVAAYQHALRKAQQFRHTDKVAHAS